MSVAVVVPNWNGRHLLPECLESLSRQTIPARVIVVDNGSEDGSADLVKSRHPDVVLVELEHNHGFAGGVNRGIQAAVADGAEFVALFNNDARADEAWLEHLVATMRAHDDVGIVTSKVLQADGRHFDAAGSSYSVWGLPVPRGREELDVGQYDAAEYVFSGIGGASLYRAQLLNEIGLFDEDFFIYFEDDDLGFRAQLAGWKARYEPSSVAHHRLSATMSKQPRLSRHHMIKNCFFVFHKDMPMPLYLRYLPRFLVGFLMVVGITAKQGHYGAIASASREILKSARALARKRRSVQRSRVVSIQYLESMLSRRLVPAHRRPFGRAHTAGAMQRETA